jgi:PIN domain nuclease of toxin-antitoxin system
VKALLDTHYLLWILLDLPKVDEFPWLERYRPWGVSPASLLEVQFLSEVGRLEVRQPEFVDAVSSDPRFVLDDVPFERMIRHALPLDWTRDPFDRMLAAHSSARRVPLCTLDRRMRRLHPLVVPELR